MAGYLADKGVRILRMGYAVIPISPGGKFPKLARWQTVTVDEAVVNRWLRNGHSDDGIGIRTEFTPLVDLDTPDPGVAMDMQNYVHFTLGLLAPVRIGNAPKRGLLFRVDTPFRKIASKTYLDEQGRDTRVEVLGQGQQFVAYHIHPDTGRPYLWGRGDGPEFVRPEDLPTLTEETAQAIVNHFEGVAATHGWAVKASGTTGTTTVAVTTADDDLGLDDEPLPGISEERVLATVMAIPNDERMDDRTAWLHFGMGWRHQYPTHGGQFDNWSDLNPRYNDLKWASFDHRGKPGRPITFRHLIKLAKERGPAEFERLLREQKTKGGIEWICKNIKLVELHEEDEENLAKTVQQVYVAVTGTKLPIKSARSLVKHPKTLVTVDGFELTEDGVALAFANRHRDQLKFCQTTGQWHHWNGAYWQVERTRLAFDWARDICRDLRAEAKSADALARAGAAAAVETFARADRAFSVLADIWDTNPWLLGTPSGTVDLRTGVLREALPEDYITKATAVGPAETARCPIWHQFLGEVTNGDKEYQRFLQQAVGYGLTGETTEQILIFLYGTGGNGKGVFLNTLDYIFHDYVKASASATFTADARGGFSHHPTELADLHGARLVTVSEIGEGRAWNTERIKAVTGGDVISARFMHKDFFQFKPQFLLLVIGNNKPELQNVDDAIRRRVKMAPFTFKPRIIDVNLPEKLRNEAPEILRWAIDGCLDWQKNGFILPKVVQSTTAEYFSDQDHRQKWREQELEDGPYAIENRLLIESWVAYAHSHGILQGNMNNGFADKIEAWGYTRIKDSHGIRGRGFSGLRLRQHNHGWEDEL